jgi:hypothetical protein
MASSPVAIDLGDGKPRTLRFSSGALRALERESKKSVFQMMEEAQLLTTTTLFLWAGLRTETPSLTLEEVDQLVDAYMLSGKQYFELLEPVMEALVEAGVLKRAKSNGNGANADPPATPGPE